MLVAEACMARRATLALAAVFCMVLVVSFVPHVALADDGSALGAGTVSLQETASVQAASGKASKSLRQSAASKRKPVYRIYNPFTGEHLFTASKKERNELANADWRYEGVAWMAPRNSGDKVYRLYNRKAKDHMYTTSKADIAKLKKRGWKNEGACWRSARAKASTSVKVYYTLNKHARVGKRFLTISRTERNDLVSQGWISKGVAFYGFKVGRSFADDMEIWEPGISGDKELDIQLKEILKTHTDLRSCFQYVVGFGYISGNRFFSNPRILSDETTIAFAKEILANHGGNCYRFACLFSWLARGLGYQTNVISGWVPAAGGGTAPHGWVEVYENGITYIYDPDLAHELPGYNWFGCTYATAPTTYGSW